MFSTVFVVIPLIGLLGLASNGVLLLWYSSSKIDPARSHISRFQHPVRGKFVLNAEIVLADQRRMQNLIQERNVQVGIAVWPEIIGQTGGREADVARRKGSENWSGWERIGQRLLFGTY